MKNITNLIDELKDYAFIAAGVALYSLGMTIFMLPYGLTSGGVSGIASIIYYSTGLEVQVTYVAINICLLIAAVRILGVRFCIKTIYAVFLMTFLLWLMQRIVEEPSAQNPDVMTLPHLIGEESFMACVLGALTCGIGLAICFENNGSTGGTDIIAAIVNKYRPTSLGSVIRACDVVIISSCYFVFHDWYRVIYGFVMLLVCSITLDYCIRRQHQSVQFLIFSRNATGIADAIITSGHGATMLNGEGWYTHTERRIVTCIINWRYKNFIMRLVKNIDPYAFVSMTDASGVWGDGFDQMKTGNAHGANERRTIVFASNSKHKLAEARAILGDRYDIRSLADIGCYIDIAEKAGSLRGNALLKARFVKRYYGFDCFADDTAIECDALGGLPGIHSRNYAAVSDEDMARHHDDMETLDEHVSQEMLDILHSHPQKVDKPQDRNDAANIARLLRELEGKESRKARAHTVVAFVTYRQFFRLWDASHFCRQISVLLQLHNGLHDENYA